MSAIHASVSCGLSQVSVTARMSIVLEIIRSVIEAVFSRIERMLVVARRMLCLTTGPGLRLTSPASSKIIRIYHQIANDRNLTNKAYSLSVSHK